MTEEKYPTTKEILIILGIGTVIAASFIAPGLPIALGAIQRAKRKHDWEQNQKAWKKFNVRLLKRNLKRLYEQKIIEIKEKDGQEVIKLTQRGHTKYLKFKMEDWSMKNNGWDGKWRLVIYDVSKLKRNQQENFRRILKQMNFWPLQKSVYLTPHKCQEAVSYLREYFNLGEEVLFLEVSKLENDHLYKQYFGF